MYKRILLSLSLLTALACFGADTAGDYFHRGAQFYIWGKRTEAKNEIFTGLKLFPDDVQLNGLAGLLKKEEEQQQQQQQQQQNQQQQQDQQKDQSKQDQNQQQQKAQQDQQKNDSAQQKEQNQKQEQSTQKPKPSPDEQKQQPQPAQEAEKSKDDSEQKERDEAYAAGKMTPEQARQLLDTQKGEELMLPAKPEGKPADRRRPVKDW